MARYGRGSSCELARASEIKMSNKLRVGIVTSVGPLGTIPERFVQFGRWVEGIPWLRGRLQVARAFTEAILVERRQFAAKSIIIGSGRGGRLSPFQSVVVIAWR